MTNLLEQLANHQFDTQADGSNDGGSVRDVTPYVPKDSSKAEKFLARVVEKGYDIDHIEEILKEEANQLIVSSAGSGKTTTLLLKLLYERYSGLLSKQIEVNGNVVNSIQRVWVSTFLNSAAFELKRDLGKLCTKLGIQNIADKVTFSTLHSEFARIIKQHDTLTKSDQIGWTYIDQKKNSTIFKNIVNRYNVTNQGRTLNQKEINDLESAISYSRAMIGAERYSHPTLLQYGVSPSEVNLIIKDWAEVRRKSRVKDFDDLQDEIYNALYPTTPGKVVDEVMLKLVQNAYDFIYIDEFQDTSQKQYAILKAYMGGAKRIVAIGDDDQTIYSWRGSDVSIISEVFIRDFNPVISNLSYNYRCPANIVNSIAPSIQNNTYRLDKELKAKKEGGVVRLGRYSSINAMVKSLKQLIYDDLSRGEKVTVLVRENKDALLPALMIDSDNRFSYSLTGGGMTLKSYMANRAVNVIRMVHDKGGVAVKDALSQLVYNGWEIDGLVSACKNEGSTIFTISEQDIIHSCPHLANTLLMWRSYYNQPNNTPMDMVRYLLSYYASEVYGGSDTDYSLNMQSILTTLAVYAESVDYATVGEFLYDIEEITERMQTRIGAKNCDVVFSTVYEYKGKENDSVYIWNDSVGMFPHKKATTWQEVEEERRVHYIGATRPRKTLTLMTLKGREGKFLKEMNLSGAESVSLVGVGGGIPLQGSLGGKSLQEAKNLKNLEQI